MPAPMSARSPSGADHTTGKYRLVAYAIVARVGASIFALD